MNWKKTGVNGVEQEKTVLTALNRKNSGLNSLEPEKKHRR